MMGGRIAGRSRVVKIALWLTVPLFPVFCLLGLDGMGNSGQWKGPVALCVERPGSLCLEVLLVLLLFGFLLLLLRQVWRAAALLGVASGILGYADYMKMALNGDPLLPQDLLLATHAKNLLSFISGEVPDWFPFFAAGLVLWAALFFWQGLALPRRGLPLRVAGALALILGVTCVSGAKGLYSPMLGAFGMSLNEMQDPVGCYRRNGFVGGSALFLLGMRTWVPEGYSDGAVEEILSPYQPVPASASDPFDVIVVLSESFSDVRELPGVSFSENPLAGYDALRERENCRSGDLYVTAMSGGTVRTEFSVLTGLSMDFLGGMSTPWRYVSRPLESYVSLYRESGYHTMALHPYDGTFYSRNQAFPWLGFDDFLTQPDVEQMGEVEYRGGHVSDRFLTEVALSLMEEQAREAPGTPLLLYIATMEGHQPYPALQPEEIAIEVEAPGISEEARSLLTAYVQRLADADRMLTALAEWMDARERPTLLVFFGDHRPNLGADHLTYCETGLYNSRDGFTPEEYRTVFHTPFLVYSNRALEWDMLPRRTGNAISDYSLLTAAARASGAARSSWMELLADRVRRVPYWNVRLQMEPTPDSEELARDLQMITYDRLLGHNRSSDGGKDPEGIALDGTG